MCLCGSFLLGGLNFQIEHHLFPGYAHNHYPAIAKIVEVACCGVYWRAAQSRGRSDLTSIG